MTRACALSSALVALAGCSVTYPDVLDEGVFACASAGDCGPDQACAEGNVYGPDFCRPACDRDDPSSCPDGVCTAAGACLQRCTIKPDGTPLGCPPGDELACVRIDAREGEGVCYPVRACSVTSECDETELCLNDALGLPAATGAQELRFDNLYCTARADGEGRCPMGYLSFRFANADGTTSSVCYAPCELDGDGPWCPPATTCFRGFGELVGTPDTPPCVPGVWGLPCEDDTQCLLGRCLSVGGGRRACTETCAGAEEYGGCEGLSRYADLFGTPSRLRCERVGGEDVCVPRFDMLSLCSDQLDCAGGESTTCTEVDVGDGVRAHVCVRFCASAEDCAAGTGGTAAEYRCIPAGAGGVCMRKRPLGARCAEDADCLDGRCCDYGGGLEACALTCPG